VINRAVLYLIEIKSGGLETKAIESLQKRNNETGIYVIAAKMTHKFTTQRYDRNYIPIFRRYFISWQIAIFSEKRNVYVKIEAKLPLQDIKFLFVRQRDVKHRQFVVIVSPSARTSRQPTRSA
jgi:hypothetical protein